MTQQIEYRLYTFSHQYLSPLQKGLQTAHLVEELNLKYNVAGNAGWRSLQGNVKSAYNILTEWGKFHKTIIILNGFNSANLLKIYNELFEICESLSLPFAKFNEDESLNNALTCVGIVVPMTIINKRMRGEMEFCTPQDKLQELIKGYGLAN